MDPAELDGLKSQLTAVLAQVAGSNAPREAGRILDAVRTRTPVDCHSLALEWAGRRAAGAPLGIILGRQHFLGLNLLAEAGVLAPREETEILGNEVLAILRALTQAHPGRELRMIDMGCGSGNLACAVAMAVPQTRVWGSDITLPCVNLTRANVAHFSLQDRIQVFQGDLFAPLLNKGLEGTMDLVVMNPPYIPSSSLANSHACLLQHEPREAFDGGPYGISILTRLLQEAPPFLKQGGHLLFEFGLGQSRMVQTLVQAQGLFTELRFALDANGDARAAILREAPKKPTKRPEAVGSP